VFNEVLLEAALFVAALSVMYRTTKHSQHSDQKMEQINEKNEKHSIIQVKDRSMKKTAHKITKTTCRKTAHKLFVFSLENPIIQSPASNLGHVWIGLFELI